MVFQFLGRIGKTCRDRVAYIMGTRKEIIQIEQKMVCEKLERTVGKNENFPTSRSFQLPFPTTRMPKNLYFPANIFSEHPRNRPHMAAIILTTVSKYTCNFGYKKDWICLQSSRFCSSDSRTIFDIAILLSLHWKILQAYLFHVIKIIAIIYGSSLYIIFHLVNFE